MFQLLYTRVSCINVIWTAIVGEELPCAREVGNAKGRYAISVLQDSHVVEHLSQKISRVCSLFILQGGTITCIVSGHCWYSADLPQGGVEVPCILVFRGKKKYLLKINKSVTITTCSHECRKYIINTIVIIFNNQILVVPVGILYTYIVHNLNCSLRLVTQSQI